MERPERQIRGEKRRRWFHSTWKIQWLEESEHLPTILNIVMCAKWTVSNVNLSVSDSSFDFSLSVQNAESSTWWLIHSKREKPGMKRHLWGLRFGFIFIMVTIHWTFPSFQENSSNASDLSLESKWRHVQEVGYPGHIIVATSLAADGSRKGVSGGLVRLVFTGKCAYGIGYIAACGGMVGQKRQKHEGTRLRKIYFSTDIVCPKEKNLPSSTQMVSHW
jgi:hypothetical protein